MAAAFEIGAISDTHGQLRPEALIALEGSAVIFHAGDICGQWIISQLEELAPTYAVAGNCDEDTALDLIVCKELGGLKILMYHGHLLVEEAAYKADIIITGHTHRPAIEWEGKVLRLNPGSAGPRRFNLPVTLMRVTVTAGQAEARLIPLNP